jgi:hypothetical protein
LPKNFGATESRLAAGFQLLGKHYTIAAFRKPKIGGVKSKVPACESILISIFVIPAFPAYFNGGVAGARR